MLTRGKKDKKKSGKNSDEEEAEENEIELGDDNKKPQPTAMEQ